MGREAEGGIEAAVTVDLIPEVAFGVDRVRVKLVFGVILESGRGLVLGFAGNGLGSGQRGRHLGLNRHHRCILWPGFDRGGSFGAGSLLHPPLHLIQACVHTLRQAILHLREVVPDEVRTPVAPAAASHENLQAGGHLPVVDEVAGIPDVFEVHGGGTEVRPRHDVVARGCRQPQMPAQSEIEAPSNDQRCAIGRDVGRLPSQFRTELHPAGAGQQVGRERREGAQVELRFPAVPSDPVLPCVTVVDTPPVEAAQPDGRAEFEARAEAGDGLIVDAEGGIEGLCAAEGLEQHRGAGRWPSESAVVGPIPIRPRRVVRLAELQHQPYAESQIPPQGAGARVLGKRRIPHGHWRGQLQRIEMVPAALHHHLAFEQIQHPRPQSHSVSELDAPDVAAGFRPEPQDARSAHEHRHQRTSGEPDGHLGSPGIDLQLLVGRRHPHAGRERQAGQVGRAGVAFAVEGRQVHVLSEPESGGAAQRACLPEAERLVPLRPGEGGTEVVA